MPSSFMVVPVIFGPTVSTPALMIELKEELITTKATTMRRMTITPILRRVLIASPLLAYVLAKDLQVHALEAHDRLRVLDDPLPDHGDGLLQREFRDAQYFVLSKILLAPAKLCRLVDVDHLVGEARRRVGAHNVLERSSLVADLLFHFAKGTLARRSEERSCRERV